MTPVFDISFLFQFKKQVKVGRREAILSFTCRFACYLSLLLVIRLLSSSFTCSLGGDFFFYLENGQLLCSVFLKGSCKADYSLCLD